MKIKALSAAVAAVSLATLSQGASAGALTKAQTLAVPAANVLYVSGASAQDNNLSSLMTTMCGTFTKWIDTSTSGKDYAAYACSAVAGPLVGQNVVIHKRSKGGSAQGVQPLIAGTAIQFIDLNTCADADKKCTGLTNKVSDLGISDVDPGMFKGLNTPAGFTAVDDTSSLTVKPAAVLAMGFPVSYNLYVALQTIQGLRTATACNTAATEYTEACMPSLAKQTISSLVSGQITNWDEIVAFDPAVGNYVGLTQFTGVTAPANNLVHFCKRTAGSGTAATQYARFLNSPCTGNGLPVATDNAFGPRVYEIVDSGNMESCLTDFSNGAAVAKNENGTTVNPTSAKAWAFGQQGMEKNDKDAAGNIPLAYRFVKIDGVAPTLENIFTGKYYNWAELTWQYKNTLAGNKLSLAEYLIGKAADPVTLGGANNNLKNSDYPFGRSGYLAAYNAAEGYAFGDALDAANPVAPFSHGSNGTLDNCSFPSSTAGNGNIRLK